MYICIYIYIYIHTYTYIGASPPARIRTGACGEGFAQSRVAIASFNYANERVGAMVSPSSLPRSLPPSLARSLLPTFLVELWSRSPYFLARSLSLARSLAASDISCSLPPRSLARSLLLARSLRPTCLVVYSQAVLENPQILNPSYSFCNTMLASKDVLFTMLGKEDALDVMLKNPAVLQCGPSLDTLGPDEIKVWQRIISIYVCL